jgi:hypothetical protein
MLQPRLTLLCLLLCLPILRAQSFQNPRHIPTVGDPIFLASADFNGDGRPDFYYLDPSSNPYQIGRYILQIAQPDGTYLASAPITLPFGLSTCSAFDLNHDTFADLVCVTTGTAQTQQVATLLGNGDGTFKPARIYTYPGVGALSPNSQQIQGAADLNGDGKLDVVISDSTNGQLVTLLGDGAGSFTSTPTTRVVYDASFRARPLLADLNGDGKVDLVATPNMAYFGVGDGTFTRPTAATFPASNCIFADLDGDHHVDAICATSTSIPYSNASTPLQVFHGNLDGSFATTPFLQQTYSSLDLAAPLAVADINHDGILDLIAVSTDDTVIFFGQHPSGQASLTLAPPVHYSLHHLGAAYDNSLIADFNGDGILDLAASGPNGIYIAYGRANATFAAPLPIPSGDLIGFAVAGDFDGDGIPDVVTSGSKSLLLNSGIGDGTFRPATAIEAASVAATASSGTTAFLYQGDFNGDGKPDLLATNITAAQPSSPHIIFNTGNGTFSAPALVNSFIPSGITANVVGIADINGDHRDDILFPNGNSSTAAALTVLLSNGDATFTAVDTPIPVLGAFNYYNSAPAAADFNHDGKADVVVAANSYAQILLGHGDGTFTLGNRLTLPLINGVTATYVPAVVTGDFDHDGIPDIALLATSTAYFSGGNSGPTALILFYGNGDGTFQAPITAGLYDHGYVLLSTSDFNSDGITDFVLGTTLAYGNGGDIAGSIAVVLGQSTRRFAREINLGAGHLQSSIGIADFNRDGHPDLLLADGGGPYLPVNSFVVLLNQPTPTATGLLTIAPEPSLFGQPFTLNAALQPPIGGITTLAGTVAFSFDGAPIQTVPLANNTASAQVAPSTQGTTSLAVGTHTIQAIWSGDANFPALTLNATHTIAGIATTLSLAASPNPSTVAQPVTFTAILTQSGGPTTNLPSGPITFADNGTVFATITPTGTTVLTATATQAFLPAGPHAITAAYAGNSTYLPSSATLSQAVTQLPSQTTLTSTLNPSTAGQTVTFTAAVAVSTTPGTPDLAAPATVTLTGLPTGSTSSPVTPGPGNNATAAFTVPNLPAARYALTATYSGNINVAASTSPALIQVVSPAVTTTSLTATPNPAFQSQNVTLTATIAGGFTPTGGVQFVDSGTPLSQSNVTGTTATISLSTLAVGTHAITASYSGDASNQPSNSPVLHLVIQPSDFNLALSPTSLVLVSGQHSALTLTATSIGAFADTLLLSVTNVPQYATGSFLPIQLTLQAGSSASTTVSIDTSPLPGFNARTTPVPGRSSLPAVAFASLLVSLGLRRHRASHKLRSILVALCAFVLVSLTACSSAPIHSVTPGNYTIQITATGSQTHATHTIALPVQIMR